MGRRPNSHFSKEDIHVVKKHRKRCSTLLIIREMQIKTTMRYQFILTRMVIIKKSTNDKIGECVERRELTYTVGGNVNWYSHNGEKYGGSLKI